MKQIIVSLDTLRTLLPVRKRNVHKGSMGNVLVIAGSRGMTGAAILSSRAVLRSGAGVATLATPVTLADGIDLHNTEVMTYPLPETKPGVVSQDALSLIGVFLKKVDAVLIGPGLGAHDSTILLVEKLLQYISQKYHRLPVVLDADGLRGLASIRRGLKMPLIITPHFGELGRLLGRTPKEIAAKPVFFALQAAKKYRATVVLKSYLTFTCVPGKDFYFLTVNGNPGMATAGSGDVLAGIITGLVASGQITPLAAAVAGPYVHALAGNIAAHQRSVDGIIASDILDAVPAALKAVKGW